MRRPWIALLSITRIVTVRFSALLLLTVFSGTLSGTLHATETESELLRQQLSEITAGQFASGSFEQDKTLHGLDISLHSSGRFNFRDDLLLWQVTAPIATELQISREQIVQFEDGREVFRLRAEDQPLSRLISDIFLAVFSGDWQQLEQHFVLQLSGQIDNWLIQLTPRNELITHFASAIEIRGGAQLHSLQLQERNGDRSIIHFQHESGE